MEIQYRRSYVPARGKRYTAGEIPAMLGYAVEIADPRPRMREGKLEPGETHQQALIRECREELGITVEVGDEFCDVYHQYPDIYVHLVVFNAKIAEGTPQLLEHCGLEWITPQEIKNYAFCPADKDILQKIINTHKEKPRL